MLNIPDKRRVRRMVLEYVVQAALLLALLVPIFPGVFLRGEVAFPGNFIYLKPPWEAYRPADLAPQNPYLETPTQANVWYTLTTRALSRGEWPLWNPYQFTGTPLLGVYQTAIFYPPRLIFLGVSDNYVAFTIFQLFKVWLAGMTAYVCARGLGISRGFGRFFSIGYMLGGYVVTWCCYPTSDSMGWAPILFLGFENLIDGRRMRGFALTFLAFTLMALAAGAQHTLTFSLILGLYFLVRLAGMRSVGHAISAAATAIAAGLAAFLVCAIQLLPFLEFLGQSVSALDTILGSTPTAWRYAPTHLLTLWTPWYFGTYFHGNFWGALHPFYLAMAYIGIPMWLGVALAFRAFNLPHRLVWRVRCLLAVSLVAFLFALRVPGVSAVFALPMMQQVRPVYFVSFAIFGLPLAATMALQHWSSIRPGLTRLWPALVLCVAVLGATLLHVSRNEGNLALYGKMMDRDGSLFSINSLDGLEALPLAPQNGTLIQFVHRQVTWTICMFILSLACLVMVSTKRVPTWFAVFLLTAALTVDLTTASFGLQPTSRRAHVFPEVPLVEYLQEQGHPYRVSFNATGLVGYPTVFDIEESRGYDALYPKRFWTVGQGKLSPDAWAAFQRTFATPCFLFFAPEQGELELPEEFELVQVIDDIIVAENTRALPRARLVGTVETFESTEAMFDRMETPGFDPAEVVLADVPLPFELPAVDDTSPGQAEIVEWNWNRVLVKVDTEQEAALVLADAFYPGWEARTDDGQLLGIFPAYHLFRGVQVPAGQHTIEFRFRPLSFRLGAAISVSALLMMLVFGVSLLLRRPKQHREAP